MVKSIPPTSFFCLTAQIYVLFVFWDVACGKVKLIEDYRWTNWFIGAGNLNLFGLVNYSSGGMAGDNVCRSSLSWAKVGRFKILFPLFLKRDIYNILSWWYHILSPTEKNKQEYHDLVLSRYWEKYLQFWFFSWFFLLCPEVIF